MASVATTRSQERVPEWGSRYADHWQRLHAERGFRIEQLAALEAETPASERHESVTRVLRSSATAALAEVDAALVRMAEGGYGKCVSCGQQIDDERLDVLPMASLCMGCHYNEQNCHVAGTASSRHG